MKISQPKMDMYFDAVAQPQSSYALRNFVDGGQLTPERRFKQAVIELNSSQKSLREAQYLLESLQIDFLEVQDRLISEEDYTGAGGVYDRKRDKLKARKLDYEIKELMRGLSGLEREMLVHLEMVQKYQEELGFDEDTKLQDVIDRLDAAESDHYVTKLAMDIASSFVASKGGPNMGVSLACQQLPEEDLNRLHLIVKPLIANMMEKRYTKELHCTEGVKVLQAGSSLKLSANDGVPVPTHSRAISYS